MINPSQRDPELQEPPKWLSVLGDAVESEGIRLVAYIGSTVLETIETIVESIPTFLSSVQSGLGKMVSGLSTLDLINTIKWWMYERKDPKVTAQKTAMMVCYTASQLLTPFQLIGEFYAAFAVAIGGIPILSTIGHFLGFGSSLFDGWHHIKILTNSDDGQTRKERQVALNALKFQETNFNTLVQPGQEAANAQLIQEIINEETQPIQKVLKKFTLAEKTKYIREKFKWRISQYEQGEQERKHHWIAIVNDVINIAYAILACVGLAVGFLSVTGLPMIMIGLVVMGIGTYEYYYRHAMEKSATERPTLVTLVEDIAHPQFLLLKAS